MPFWSTFFGISSKIIPSAIKSITLKIANISKTVAPNPV